MIVTGPLESREPAKAIAYMCWNDVYTIAFVIAHRAPRATVCLITALARHGLTDVIPAMIDVALPRGVRHPRVAGAGGLEQLRSTTFDIDREHLPLTDELTIGLYGPRRCIIDAFRLRHQEGADVAVEALRRWLRRPGTQPAALLAMAGHFPKAQRALRAACRSCCERAAATDPDHDGRPRLP